MYQQSELASSMEKGDLGIYHLKRLWAKAMLGRKGQLPEELRGSEWTTDLVVIDGLGLPLEETMAFLYQEAADFQIFEQWILEKNNGAIEQQRIDRINASIEGVTYNSEVRAAISDIESAEPVLDKEALAFWEENGYVRVPGAVSHEKCQAAEQAIWEFMGMDPDVPDTWYQGQPSIMVSLYDHPALWATRKSPRIHKAFAQIWGTADLWVTVDRAAFNPPERHDWSFPGPSLHWDTSLIPPIRFGVQGILCLTDTTADQGAFTTVPGFHKRIDEWLRSLPPDADPRTQDLLSLGTKSIPGQAGDLIIWHNAMPHGASPNRATRPRIVQFIDMYPTKREFSDTWK
jgi:hypothetical protein